MEPDVESSVFVPDTGYVRGANRYHIHYFTSSHPDNTTGGRGGQSPLKEEGGERVAGYIILAGTTLICAIGWLSRYISAAILIRYLDTKNYTLPTDEELKACSAYVVDHILRDIFKRKRHF